MFEDADDAGKDLRKEASVPLTVALRCKELAFLSSCSRELQCFSWRLSRCHARSWHSLRHTAESCRFFSIVCLDAMQGKGKKLRRRDFARSISQTRTEEEFVGY